MNPYSIAGQRTSTDGRIVPVGKSFIRRPSKCVGYLLRYRRDFPLAVLKRNRNTRPSRTGYNGKPVRRNPRITVRLCEKWRGNNRARLLHGQGSKEQLISEARKSLAAFPQRQIVDR